MDLRLMLAIGLGGFARHCPDVLLCAGEHDRTWLTAAGHDEKRRLYSLTRDLGGAIGLASIGTIMNVRLHFHWNRLIEDINPARAAVHRLLEAQMGQFYPLIPGDPSRAAINLLANLAQREALMLTYNDLLLLLARRSVRLQAYAAAAGPPPAFVLRPLTFWQKQVCRAMLALNKYGTNWSSRIRTGNLFEVYTPLG
jgi:hypothetical protein